MIVSSSAHSDAWPAGGPQCGTLTGAPAWTAGEDRAFPLRTKAGPSRPEGGWGRKAAGPEPAGLRAEAEGRPGGSAGTAGTDTAAPARGPRLSRTLLFALAKPKVIQFALITTISPELSPDSDRRSL